MDPVSAIALSGMNAASLRMRSSASNLANMDDEAPLPNSGAAGPKPYAPTHVSSVSLGAGGVQAQLLASSPASQPASDPPSPYADRQGMVAAPKVDVVEEVVTQVAALAQFKAAVQTLNAEGAMQKSMLDILR